MKRKTLTWLALTAFSAVLCASPITALAQAYPNKPVKVIIPFPPGGTLDAVGRQLAQKLGEQLGQSFVVENRPGGNGIIGADVVAKAPADGYTLLFNASTFTTAPMTMKQVPYTVEKDFAPVALVAKAPLSVAINKNLPVTDIRSLIAYAKSKGGKATFAVGSVGSAGHLATELLKKNGMDYTVLPSQTVLIPGMPTGEFRYEAKVAGFGLLQPAVSRSLSPSETFTITLYPR